jgi:hypothetical protein
LTKIRAWRKYATSTVRNLAGTFLGILASPTRFSAGRPLTSQKRRWEAFAVTSVCTVLSMFSGCAGQSNFLTGGPTVGQLKTSLSHLEYENEQLKKRTAKLEKENRTMENRLVQEQLSNGDLTARLDDARNVLRDRGVESDVKLGARRRDDDQSVGDEDSARARTAPASRSAKQRRKPPFAQISSGPAETQAPSDDDTKSTPASRTNRSAKTGQSRRANDDDLDHHSFHTGSLRWLPVADAAGDTPIQIR